MLIFFNMEQLQTRFKLLKFLLRLHSKDTTVRTQGKRKRVMLGI